MRGTRPSWIVHTVAATLLCATVVSACATTASTDFDRNLKARRWSDAAIAFETDSSLQNNEHALFAAAMLHSYPNRETYNPALARALFYRLLRLYPSTTRRQTVVDHLAILNEMERVRQDSTRREREIQAEMARLIADTQLLLGRLDSLTRKTQNSDQQNEQLRKQVAKLEAEAKDRDEQLRTLRAELAKLKEIDLNPARRTPVTDSARR